jgi:peptidoglycan/LPS O-acetylase OafA/YrhL
VEAFFYLTFPLWILDWQRWNWLKLPVSLLPLLMIIDFTNFAKLAQEDWAPGITQKGMLYVFPLTRLPEFVLGVVLGEWWSKRRFTWSFLPSLVAEIAAVCALFWALASVWPIAHMPTTRLLVGEGGAYWLLECGFTPIFAFFIFVMASSNGPLARLFHHHAMILLGEISFAIYLFHTILLRYYQSLPPFVHQNPAGFRMLYWAGVIAISFLAFELVENPLRGLITGRPVKPSFDRVSHRRAAIGIAFSVAAISISLPRF